MEIEMGLVEFAAEFVLVARRDCHESSGLKKAIFTSRQSQAITCLGISRIIRSGEQLGLYNLVKLSVVTSPPEAQKYAEMIALRILVGDERENFSATSNSSSKPTDPEEETLINQLTGSQMLLTEILDFLDLATSVNNDKDRKELEFADIAEDFLFNSETDRSIKNNEKIIQMVRREQFLEIGGREGIISKKITNWEQLQQLAKKSMLQSIPNLTVDGVIRGKLLNLGPDIRHLTKEKKISELSELLDGADHSKGNGFSIRGKELIGSMSVQEKIQALKAFYRYSNILQQYNINQEETTPSLSQLIEQLENTIQKEALHLDDILDFPHLFQNRLEYDQMVDFLQETMKSTEGLDLLEKAQMVDDLIGTNFADMVSDTLMEEFSQTEIRDWLNKFVPSSGWIEQLQQKLNQFNGHTSWEERKNLIEQLEENKKVSSHPYLSDVLTEAINEQLTKWQKQSTDLDQITEAVNFARDNNYTISNLLIREIGRSIGLSEKEIATLIGDVFEHLKFMIKEEQASYERVKSLTTRNRLDNSQISELTKLSIEHGSEGALAGLMDQNFELVLKNVPNTEEGKELLGQAMGAGDGENLLKNWFKHSHSLPSWMRSVVREAAKRIMIDLAKAKAAALIGSSEAGPLPEGTTRPLILGDDPDMIDLDETLDNILFLGKRIKQVTIEDFIVRKTVSGRRCVIFLVDISGSMSGAPLASATLTTTMLLYAFSRDELGVALFESDTHVICEINTKIEIDVVADKLLNLRAKGGTQMQRALEWAENQFKKSASKDKMFVMVTDAMIGDFSKSSVHLRNIADQEVISILVMPSNGYGLRNIQEITNAANAQLVTVQDWKKFPEVVSQVLSRV